MPRIDPADYRSLPLEAFSVVDGFELHDVWRVELEGFRDRTLQDLRSRLGSGDVNPPGLAVRGLFRIRSILGKVLRLDHKPRSSGSRLPSVQVPDSLASRSIVPPGQPEGPFTTLYVLPRESAYEALNATVHAILVVALERRSAGQRFYWATYVKPVGRVTGFYMGAIDPFRRRVVYPGLEAWLKRVWAN